jgi:hypothetical protein
LTVQGSGHGIGHFGPLTVNTLRIEKGFKMWGNEMNCDVDIIDAGLDNFVRWNKKVRRFHLKTFFWNLFHSNTQYLTKQIKLQRKALQYINS